MNSVTRDQVFGDWVVHEPQLSDTAWIRDAWSTTVYDASPFARPRGAPKSKVKAWPRELFDRDYAKQVIMPLLSKCRTVVVAPKLAPNEPVAFVCGEWLTNDVVLLHMAYTLPHARIRGAFKAGLITGGWYDGGVVIATQWTLALTKLKLRNVVYNPLPLWERVYGNK